MTLIREISELRAKVEAHKQSFRAPDKPQSADAPRPDEAPRSNKAQHGTIEALLDAATATFNELGEDIEQFPMLTALAAFGAGLFLGLALGSRSR